MKFWHVAAWHGSAGYSSPFSKTNFVNKFNSREYFFHHFFFSTNVKRTLAYQPYDDLLSVICCALVLYSFDFLFKRRFVCVSLYMNKRHSDARYMHIDTYILTHTKCRTSHAKICKEIKRIIMCKN